MMVLWPFSVLPLPECAAATEQDATYTILVCDIKPIFVDLAKALARSELSDLASFLRSEKSLFDLRSIKH